MAEQSTMTLDAQIVRRFLAKAYGDDHPAMEALDRLAPPPATLHGDFGAMDFTRKQDHESCSHWGLVYSD